MKNKLYRSLTALAFAGMTLPMMAAPARPGAFTRTQPDGTQVTLTLHGDEHFHYMMDAEGYLVGQQQDGWYRILDNNGVATTLLPMDYNLRSDADKEKLMQIRPSQTFEVLRNRSRAIGMSRAKAATAYSSRSRLAGAKWDNADGHDLRAIPTEGERPALVILVNFSDLRWSFADNPQAEMTDMLNEPGYSRNHCEGSARDFFLHSSNGLYQPKFDVYGPVELGKPYSYYGKNSQGQDVRPWEMLSDAVALLDDTVDFSIYDTNGDGYVDNVFVFYAGYGENEGAGDDYVWPHAYSLEYVMVPPEADGVKISRYACTNELTLRRIGDDVKTHSGIGTFCHEFSHVLGLPDLYATSYTGAFTPGEYSTMDHGSYNNNSRTPPLYSIYEKYAMEWEKPIDINENAEISMLPTVDGGKSYRITIDPARPTEYFLFENRQQHGRDTYIPGHGMLVWHIDFNQGIWDGNVVNNNPDHQYCDIVEADGAGDEGSMGGDPFPGNNKQSEFIPGGVPAFKNWDGKASKFAISNIGEDANGVVSFRVGDGGTEDSPLYVAAPSAVLTNVDDTSLSLEWEPVAGAKYYYINVVSMYLDELWGVLTTEQLKDYTFTNLGNETKVKVTGLEPAKSYRVSVFAGSDNNISNASQGFYSTFANDMSKVVPLLDVVPGDTYADLSWFEVPEATSYEVTVATRAEEPAVLGQTVNWDNRKYPNDWMFAGGSFENGEAYVGETAPSLKFNPGTVLATGIYDQDINSIDFWTRTNIDNGTMDLVLYTVDDNGSISQIGEVKNVVNSAEGQVIKLGNFPAGVRRLMMSYNCRTAGMLLYMDDIHIYYSGNITDSPVGEYDGLKVSDTKLRVSGLQPVSEYVAYIRSIGNDTGSLPSKVEKFVTLNPSGIDEVSGETTEYTFADGVVSSVAPMSIYTIDGLPVAVNTIGSVKLPTRGIYLITIGSGTTKLVW